LGFENKGVVRTRSSATQLNTACNDIRRGGWMRWLGENHDSTAQHKSVYKVV
jgi:hypothetical protein